MESDGTGIRDIGFKMCSSSFGHSLPGLVNQCLPPPIWNLHHGALPVLLLPGHEGVGSKTLVQLGRHCGTVWLPDELHLPDRLKVGLLLAKPDCGRVLHQRTPGLFQRLCADGPASPWPPQPHPGALHRRTCAHHLAHDCFSGVEEQTQPRCHVESSPSGTASLSQHPRGG